MNDPAYPLGRFELPNSLTPAQRNERIIFIEDLPAALVNLLRNVDPADLNKKYREGSWTVREIIHHLADSHMQGFARFKLALTEDNPIIKPYEQDGWALLPDVGRVEMEPSINILKGLHQRWTVLLRTMKTPQWQRTFHHPEWNHNFTLEQSLAQYAWHSQHHLAHIRTALEK